MLAGFGASQLDLGPGAPLLYDGIPELAVDDPRTVGFFSAICSSPQVWSARPPRHRTVLAARPRMAAAVVGDHLRLRVVAWAGF